MMPNDRGIEMHRFDGEDHTLEGACRRATGTVLFQGHAGPPITAGCALPYPYHTSRYWPN
jgi:hypothetical protein